MKTKQLRHPASYSKGITLIEIMLVIGLLVILLSFAIPSVSGAATRAEMDSTFENVQYSLHMARKMARATESRVMVFIPPSSLNQAQSITFTSPGKNGQHNSLQIQDFKIPEEIVLVSEQDTFVFDRRGLVENPGKVMLVAKSDDSITSTIEVQ